MPQKKRKKMPNSVRPGKLSKREADIKKNKNKKRKQAAVKAAKPAKNAIISIRERDTLKGNVDQLKSALTEANDRINTLAEEIAKRNHNLKILSDAYIELKNNYDSRGEDISRIKSELSSRDSAIESLKSMLAVLSPSFTIVKLFTKSKTFTPDATTVPS